MWHRALLCCLPVLFVAGCGMEKKVADYEGRPVESCEDTGYRTNFGADPVYFCRFEDGGWGCYAEGGLLGLQQVYGYNVLVDGVQRCLHPDDSS